MPVRYLPDRPQWAVVADEGEGTGEMLVVLAFCALVVLTGVVCLLIALRIPASS
ncbi:hypothetical protein [Streptacidiphilus melanogenes]|uniref:hypothetical protein n=1 Tax=Streptacidiphilus melanogenes TaxID=411235 RepID=UPI001F2CC086|nr:hypothetical protein [Streptacidiphilus melanogenes]